MSNNAKTTELVGKAACLKYCAHLFRDSVQYDFNITGGRIDENLECLKLRNTEIREHFETDASVLNNWINLTGKRIITKSDNRNFTRITDSLNRAVGGRRKAFDISDFDESTSKYVFSSKLGLDWRQTQLIIDTELVGKERPEHDIYMDNAIAKQVIDGYNGVYDIYYYDCRSKNSSRILKSRLRVKNLVKVRETVSAVTSKLHMKREDYDFFPYDGYIIRRGSSIYLTYEENSADATMDTRDMVYIIVYADDPGKSYLQGIMTTVSVDKIIYSTPVALNRIKDNKEILNRKELVNLMRNNFEEFDANDKATIEKRYPFIRKHRLLSISK